jgi:uncharacterized membrane protein
VVFVVRVKAEEINVKKLNADDADTQHPQDHKFAKVIIMRGKSEKINVNKLTTEGTHKNIAKNTVKESWSRPQW